MSHFQFNSGWSLSDHQSASLSDQNLCGHLVMIAISNKKKGLKVIQIDISHVHENYYKDQGSTNSGLFLSPADDFVGTVFKSESSLERFLWLFLSLWSILCRSSSLSSFFSHHFLLFPPHYSSTSSIPVLHPLSHAIPIQPIPVFVPIPASKHMLALRLFHIKWLAKT